jgi:hypothetical protein
MDSITGDSSDFSISEDARTEVDYQIKNLNYG